MREKLDLQQQIDELQSRLVYQEDTIQSLSDVIAAQDKLLMRLQKQVMVRDAKWQELMEKLEPFSTQDKPPHY